jgi:hypothetical protein
MAPPRTLQLLEERKDVEDYQCLLITPGFHVSLILLPLSFKQVITIMDLTVITFVGLCCNEWVT